MESRTQRFKKDWRGSAEDALSSSVVYLSEGAFFEFHGVFFCLISSL